MTSFARHGANLRKHRISRANAYYSITACCVDREPLFANQDAGQFVIQAIAGLDGEQATESFVVVVMPDHLHWLFRLQGKDNLDGVVRKMKCRSARRVNELLGRQKAVWQRGYFERRVFSEKAYLALGDYILQNPVRAGLAARWQDYALVDLQWQRFGHLLRQS